MLEIKVEEDVYVMSLWWKIRPVVRMKYNEAFGRRSDEVRGDVSSRAEKRMGKEVVSTRLETLNLPDDVRYTQENGSGRELGNRSHGPVIREWALTNGRASGSSPLDPIVGLKELKRASGPAVANGYLGSKSKEAAKENDGSEAGPHQGDGLQNWATTR